MSVLVVDDNDMNRRLLHLLLKALGHKSVSAGDGIEALEVYDQVPDVEVAFFDIMMPRMDGWTLLSAVRNRPEWQGVPIIVCTALADRDSVTRAQSLGVRHFLVKPITKERVQETLQRAFELLVPRLAPTDGIAAQIDGGLERYSELLWRCAAHAHDCFDAIASGQPCDLAPLATMCATLGAPRTAQIVEATLRASSAREAGLLRRVLWRELAHFHAELSRRIEQLERGNAAPASPPASS